MCWNVERRNMRKGIVVSIVLILAIAGSMFGLTSNRAFAAALDWKPTALTTTGCNSGNIGFTTVVSGYTGGPDHFRTTVDAGGLRYMDEDAGIPGSGNATYGWHLYASNSGGPTTGTWPIPDNTPITVHFMLINGSGGPTLTNHTVVLDKCNGGRVVSGIGVSTSGGSTSSVNGPDMVNLSGAVVGTFVTSTPVYFMPQAGAAGSEMIDAGKTAYVFGVDSSKQFYEVELGGAFFWVPVKTMGPDYDNVWHGMPLPTNVVQ